MANFLDNMKIKVASKDRVKLDLSSDHISTANFMQYNVAWSKELVPNEKISVNMETFTRLNPMPVPTFGRATVNNRAFFVPFRTVFPGWNDFIEDTKHVGSEGANVITTVPVLSNASIIDYLTNTSLSLNELYTELQDGGNVNTSFGAAVILAYNSEITPDYNIHIGVIEEEDASGEVETINVVVGIKLTAKGRQFVKIMQSLGYNFVPVKDGSEEIVFSALPLLACAKVYADWYYPSAYSQDVNLSNVEMLFNYDNTSEGLEIFSDSLDNIFNLITYVNYDSDYFVSAWDKPYAPNDDGSSSSFDLDDPTSSVEVTYNSSDSAPAMTISADNKITQWGLTALKSLTDYIKRHQLVGSRALDRYMARFGINLASEKLKRSVYIGTATTPIKFGDVTSTSSTDGAALGDYAGKGLGYEQSSFEFETDEYGIMIIVSTIQPKAGYYQGFDRNVLHITKTDYWTPEFDNLGVQAIARGEVFIPTYSDADQSAIDNLPLYTEGIFGWTPRYAEYKIGRDRLTGDFRYNSMNVGTEAWHTMRELDYGTNVADIVHNVDFVRGIDAGQYSRIFYQTDADAADKFNVIYSFNVASWSPMKSLFDTYEFDGGREVSMDVNGVKMN